MRVKQLRCRRPTRTTKWPCCQPVHRLGDACYWHGGPGADIDAVIDAIVEQLAIRFSQAFGDDINDHRTGIYDVLAADADGCTESQICAALADLALDGDEDSKQYNTVWHDLMERCDELPKRLHAALAHPERLFLDREVST